MKESKNIVPINLDELMKIAKTNEQQYDRVVQQNVELQQALRKLDSDNKKLIEFCKVFFNMFEGIRSEELTSERVMQLIDRHAEFQKEGNND